MRLLLLLLILFAVPSPSLAGECTGLTATSLSSVRALLGPRPARPSKKIVARGYIISVPEKDGPESQLLCSFHKGQLDWSGPEMQRLLFQAARYHSDWSLMAMFSLLRPDACVPCLLVAGVAKISSVIGHAAFRVLSVPLLMVTVSAWLLTMTFLFAKLLSSGARIPYGPVAGSAAWLAIPLFVLGGIGGISDAGPEIFPQLYSGLVAPAVSFAVDGGNALLRASLFTSASRGSDLDAFITAALPAHMDHYATIFGTPTGAAERVVTALFRMFIAVQHLAVLGIARGALFMSATEDLGWFMTAASMILGLVLCISFLIFFIVAGLRLVDPLLRLALAIATAPVWIAGLPFDALRRGPCSQMGRSFTYAIVSLFLAGLIYGIAASMLMQAFALSIALPDATFTQLFERSVITFNTPTDDDATARALSPILERQLPPGASDSVFYLNVAPAILLVMGLLLSTVLLGSIGILASMFSGFQAQGSLAGDVERMVSGNVHTLANGVLWAGTAVAGAVVTAATAGYGGRFVSAFKSATRAAADSVMGAGESMIGGEAGQAIIGGPQDPGTGAAAQGAPAKGKSQKGKSTDDASGSAGAGTGSAGASGEAAPASAGTGSPPATTQPAAAPAQTAPGAAPKPTTPASSAAGVKSTPSPAKK